VAEKLKEFLSAAWSVAWMTAVWLVCTVAGSVLPLFFLAANKPGTEAFDFELLASGDLLLISIVLVAGTAGDLLYALCAGKLAKWGGVVALVFVGELGIFIAAVLKYMRAIDPQEYGGLHARTVAHGSFLMFGLAILGGWSTLMLKSAEG
jgi:hypothetical protein